MQVLNDKERLEAYLKEKKIRDHFSAPDLFFELICFEKGEFLTRPDKPLDSMLFIVEGKTRIFGIREDSGMYQVYTETENGVLGDLEFIDPDYCSLYSQAMDSVFCVRVSYRKNRDKLLKDPRFLFFLSSSLADKLRSLTMLDLVHPSLEEKLIYDLEHCHEDRTMTSVNLELSRLHCSRRQLQRVLAKLCKEGRLSRLKKGSYRLNDVSCD